MVKNFNLPIEYVLNEMSITNVHMYNAVLPSYDSDKDKKNGDGKIIMADDPKNAKDVDDFFKKLNGK